MFSSSVTPLAEVVLNSARNGRFLRFCQNPAWSCVFLSTTKPTSRQQLFTTSTWPLADKKRFYSSFKKQEDFPVKSVEGAEILQNVLEKNKQLLKERKNVIIQDIRVRKDKVKERVEEVIERENVATIPNLLCVGRIMMSPYLGYIIVQSDFRLAMGMLVFAGVTDLADGFIARQWPSQASRLGSFLDPMADKVLVGSLVISMSYAELLPLWLSAMILFRDVFLIGAGFVIRYISLPQPVSTLVVISRSILL